MEIKRGEEFCFFEPEIDIKETLRMTILMVRVLILGIMVTDSKESLRITNRMERVLTLGIMVTDTKEIG